MVNVALHVSESSGMALRQSDLLSFVQQGDSIIRYYELVPEPPYCHWLTNYSANVPQRGVCFMPKRGCDVTINEVAKCFKLVAKGYCEPISFTVPRKVCMDKCIVQVVCK